MLKKLLIAAGVIVVVFVVIVALQPAAYEVTRTGAIAAPPQTVFGLVNDFHKWESWSPWAKLDPQVKNTFAGTAEGTGAIFSWVGNSKVGEGRMAIVESRPSELIRMKLEFIKPFASTCDTVFAFKPGTDNTAVTWTMSGRNNFIGKAMCLFMNMDKMVGPDFERGLAQMKSVAEMAPKVTTSPIPSKKES